MKRTVTLSKEGEGNYPLLPAGIYKFQITDTKYAKYKNNKFKADGDINEDIIVVTCEVIANEAYPEKTGQTILYRVNMTGDFLWLTKLFLKCIEEPYHDGDMEIDTDAWIGRQFWGEVSHTKSKDGTDYANIKKIIYKDEKKPVTPIVNPENVKNADEILWGT